MNSGHDAVHLFDHDMHKFSDLEILNYARIENRIILTHDLDFGRLMALSGTKLPSIVIFRLKNMKPDNVNRYCDRIIFRFEDTLKKGAILSVGDKKIRCHLLPIE
jgi:predicted nuclease of predicted toxin-antitoxin system